jgi:hypothetical protein
MLFVCDLCGFNMEQGSVLGESTRPQPRANGCPAGQSHKMCADRYSKCLSTGVGSKNATPLLELEFQKKRRLFCRAKLIKAGEI